MKSAYELLLDDVVVLVERRRIQNMYLRVRPDGGVLLTAPRLTPDFVIERFARARLPWIRKHLRATAPQPKPQCESGDAVVLWGAPYRLLVTEEGRRAHAALDEANRTVRLRTPPNRSCEERARTLDALYRRVLMEEVEATVPACEQLVGKRASSWKIRDMKTRWGTCNTATAAVTLNLQLVRREKAYLRYVMIHELTHLWEPSHNARFYALMDRFLPEWKQVRKALKERE